MPENIFKKAHPEEWDNLIKKLSNFDKQIEYIPKIDQIKETEVLLNNEQEVQEPRRNEDATTTEAGNQNPSQLKEATILSIEEILDKHIGVIGAYAKEEYNWILAAMEEYKNQEIQLLNK